MDKDFILIEILFFASVIVNILVDNNLYMKFLMLILLSLFIVKYIPNYKFNKNKYLFISFNLVAISILFLILKYYNNLIFVVIFGCYLVLFLYLSKVVFSTTYGIVISKDKTNYIIKIEDVFYKSRFLKNNCTLESKKKINVGDTVLLKLSSFPLFKKPVSILKVLNESKKD